VVTAEHCHYENGGTGSSMMCLVESVVLQVMLMHKIPSPTFVWTVHWNRGTGSLT